MKYSLLFVGAALALAPMQALAATTPQSYVDRAYSQWETVSAPRASTLDLKVTYRNVEQKNPKNAFDASVHAVLDTQTFPRGEGNEDYSARLRFPSVMFKDSNIASNNFSLQHPFVVEVRSIDGATYVQLDEPSAQVLDTASEESPEMREALEGIFRQWVGFPATDKTMVEDTAQSVVSEFSSDVSLAKYNELTSLAGSKNPFQAIGYDGTRRVNGQNYVRVRVRLNPGIWNTYVAKKVALQPKDLQAAERTRLAREKKFFDSIRMVAMVNTKTLAVERVEFAGTNTQVDAGEKVTVSVQGVYTMMNIPDAIVPTPEQFMTVEELMQKVFAPALSPEEGDTTDSYDDRSDDNYEQDDWNDESTASNDDEVILYDENDISIPAVSMEDHVIGASQPKVTMVVYSDFQCPYCRYFDESLQRVLAEFPNDVRLVYRHMPITQVHEHAFMAAEASECAAKIGGNTSFWQMHHGLMLLESLDGASITSLAERIGLSRASFQYCLQSGEMTERVNQAIESAQVSGVYGVPMTFVNGELVAGSVPYEQLREVVTETLQGSSSTLTAY